MNYFLDESPEELNGLDRADWDNQQLSLGIALAAGTGISNEEAQKMLDAGNKMIKMLVNRKKAPAPVAMKPGNSNLIFIGLGLAAAAGIAYLVFKKSKTLGEAEQKGLAEVNGALEDVPALSSREKTKPVIHLAGRRQSGLAEVNGALEDVPALSSREKTKPGIHLAGRRQSGLAEVNGALEYVPASSSKGKSKPATQFAGRSLGGRARA